MKNYRKKLYYYLIYSIISLMILSMTLTKKISLIIIKIKILQAFNYWL